MKCDESIERFDDYLDGRLEAAEAEEMSKHLSGCASCAGELESIRELRDRAAALPHSLEPSRDLWPGIAAQITENKVVQGRFGRRTFLAAAAAVLIVSSVVTAYLIGRSQAVVVVEAPAVVESGMSAVLLASFEELGVDDYMATRSELLAALEARSHELSPETMDVVMDNLLLIDQAMDRIAAALGEDPENEFLMKQLAGAYKRQIDLLQRAVRLPAEV
jgi:anti-sigma factor RsiW